MALVLVFPPGALKHGGWRGGAALAGVGAGVFAVHAFFEIVGYLRFGRGGFRAARTYELPLTGDALISGSVGAKGKDAVAVSVEAPITGQLKINGIINATGFRYDTRPSTVALREKLDPNRVNGGVFLGLNGIVIKSHGSANAEGYAAAFDLAYDMVKQELMTKITESLSFDHRAVMAAASNPDAA